MSHHPVSRYWRGPLGFLIAAVIAFAAFLWSGSYATALSVLLVATVVSLIYTTGESSDLPGTSGDDNKNVPT
ncbi:MAG TPA: hypothetical protein VHE30_20060 [Polyangiaceae bacterium]|nr:hypothetical protein [Polyangiaceae bacterium]